jgi:hypothetical protein
MLRSLEEIDPELLDQAIRKLLARARPPHREAAIAAHLGQSKELREWIEMCATGVKRIAADHGLNPLQALQVQLYTAFVIGLETGYILYEREMER